MLITLDLSRIMMDKFILDSEKHVLAEYKVY